MKFCHCRDRDDIARELVRRYRVIDESGVKCATRTRRRNNVLKMARRRLLQLAGQLETETNPAMPFTYCGIDDLDRLTVSYSSQNTGSLEFGDCADDGTPGELAQYHTATDGQWTGAGDKRKLVGATYWSCAGDRPLAAPAVAVDVRLVRAGRAGWKQSIVRWREWFPNWKLPNHAGSPMDIPGWREPPQRTIADYDVSDKCLVSPADPWFGTDWQARAECNRSSARAVAKMANAEPIQRQPIVLPATGDDDFPAVGCARLVRPGVTMLRPAADYALLVA